MVVEIGIDPQGGRGRRFRGRPAPKAAQELATLFVAAFLGVALAAGKALAAPQTAVFNANPQSRQTLGLLQRITSVGQTISLVDQPLTIHNEATPCPSGAFSSLLDSACISRGHFFLLIIGFFLKKTS